MAVLSNILDPVHDTLDPTVWDAVNEAHPTLKPQHGHWILDTIESVLRENGYGDSEKWLEVYLTGSLTTFQYSDESDCDVSLFVNTDVFPEWSRAEMIALFVDKVDGTKLPGTTHPMQCFVVAKGIRPTDLYKPGLRSGYQIALNRWLVPPERSRSHDVAAEQNADYQYALECADKMERLLRYEPDKAVTFWHQIHARRRRDQQMGKGDYSQSNIIYKFLANRGLFPKLEEVSGEYIAKTAGVPGWKPGEYGKFVITPQGEVHQWRTYPTEDSFDVADARPHHGEYIRNVLAPRFQEYMNDGENDGDQWTPGWIDPAGRLSTIAWPKGLHEQRVQFHVMPAVPGTRLDSREQNVVNNMRGVLANIPGTDFLPRTTMMPRPEQIDIARQRLNIKMPVRFMPTFRDVRGGYAGVSRDPQTGQDSHLIFFNPTYSPGPRNWAAHHELAHAMQWERDGAFLPTSYLPQEEYEQLPKEAEAEAIANQHADHDLWNHTNTIEGPNAGQDSAHTGGAPREEAWSFR